MDFIMNFDIIKIKDLSTIASFKDRNEALKFLCGKPTRDYMFVDRQNGERYTSEYGQLVKLD